MTSQADVVRTWTSARELVGGVAPTDDDVPVTLDGRRLDSPEKLMAFLEEIQAQRAPEVGRVGRA